MTIIFIIFAILFIILLRWTWHSLGEIEKNTKVKSIIIGVIIIYIITLIVYLISKIGITYENKEAGNMLQTVFVILFTSINGYIILPYAFKKLNQINNDEINKEKFKKSFIKLSVIIIVLCVIEIFYFKGIQQGILNGK